MKPVKILACVIATLAALLLPAANATAQDKLKLAIGQRGFWDTAISHLGTKAGIFLVQSDSTLFNRPPG